MTETQQKKPVLRFPEFLEKWASRKVENIAPLQRGFDLPTTQIKDGKYPVVYSNGILRHHNEFKIEGPGVITGRSGTIGEVTFVDESFWPHNTTLWVTDFFGNDPKYIYYFYNQIRFERYNSGSTVPTLNRNDVHRSKAFISQSLEEQQKIAAFLSSVDTKIEQLSKKKSLLEQYKKGMMQKLFSQEIRFKDEQGKDYPDWEEKKLGCVGQITGGGTPDTNKQNLWNGDILWFTPTEIKFKYSGNSIRKISKEGLAKSSATLLPVGTILFTSRATIGEVSIARKECTTNQGFQSFIVNDLLFSNEYIYYWIIKNKKQFLRRANGSTFLEISKGEMKKISFSAPDIKEQQKIASFLSMIDKKIELVTEQIKQAQIFKKGLFQQMFV